MRIGLAGKEDASAILELRKLAYRSEAEIYDDYSIPPLTQTLEELLEEFGKCSVYKAVLGAELVGSVRARVDGGTCRIGRLVVHPRVQNRGIGSLLMSCVELRHPEVERFELFTGHRSVRNLFLYRKLGYKEFRREIVHDDLALVFLEKRNKTG